MADQTNSAIVVELNNKNNVTLVNFPATLKLTSNNYLGWKTQVEAVLHGLDLYKFIDGTYLSQKPITAADGTVTPHKDFQAWFRQDRLLFGAIVGSLSPNIIPLITNASSSLEAWNILSNTYASPSRGHIKQLQHRLKQCSKKQGQSITDYMQEIKTIVDELAILGKKLDAEDITDSILAGLDQNLYKPILDAMYARDTSISFNELHEKLINHELALAQLVTAANIHQPATAFVAQNRQNTRSWNSKQPVKHMHQLPRQGGGDGLLPTPMSAGPSTNAPRPFLGKCQWCHVKGHTLTNCAVFKKVNPTISVPSYNRHMYVQNPQVNMMRTQQDAPVNWLFDSGASHHVTNDLQNLSLHAPYDGTDELVIGDGLENEPNSTQGNGKQRSL